MEDFGHGCVGNVVPVAAIPDANVYARVGLTELADCPCCREQQGC